MKIGVLGGTFDPVHKGHLTLARESMKQFGLDKVLFVPARIPPHKKEDEELSPAPCRARMVELALLGEPRWEFSELELRRPGISYTVDTLRELRKIYPPPHELFFIAGADSLQDLEKWKDPGEILKLAEWIVAPRPPHSLPERLPAHCHRLEIVPMEISARNLRERMARGENVSAWVPEAVSSYAVKMRLYQGKTP